MTSFPRLLLLVWPVLLAGSSLSKAVTLDDLVKSSPFLPGGSEGSAPVATDNAAVEFRGMVTTPQGVFFGLYDRTKQISAWVRQDDKDADFVVKSYDAMNDMVSVDYGGQKFNLSLSSAKSGTAAPSAPVISAGQQPVVLAGGQPAVARVTDQRRLEAIAAEVRRRRALRQSTASGVAAPPAQTSGPSR